MLFSPVSQELSLKKWQDRIIRVFIGYGKIFSSYSAWVEHLDESYTSYRSSSRQKATEKKTGVKGRTHTFCLFWMEETPFPTENIFTL
ncbi:hypothetical protein OUZ56_019935 [Daphnia magna]|uniref:Uncharacterized protein n=1 Tax=Daphnia magna TaxID=35525 RepID=A0ABQ9ZD30_9CRUS|nr:hypothetical protein OUZ56_019935 [Daphnia magna]